MRLFRAAEIIAAALSLMPLTAVCAQEAMTTSERKALSSRAANRSVQRDLLSVFEPVRRINSGMMRQLRGVGLTTHAFGTEFEGLCRRDVVSLGYAATTQGLEPEDTPVRPYSVEARAWFHIITLTPKAREGSPVIWQPRCASAGRNEDANWFAAKDARTALRGALLLEAALRAVRTAGLKSAPCPSVFDPKKVTCEEAILANSDLSKLDSIEACPSSEADVVCYVVGLAGSTELTIKARMTEDGLYPSAVLSIAIEQYIIVT